MNATKIPASGRLAITYDWYRSFLQFLLDNDAFTSFGKIVALGETAIGIALIRGAFTEIAPSGRVPEHELPARR